jgi:hypothetical protein
MMLLAGTAIAKHLILQQLTSGSLASDTEIGYRVDLASAASILLGTQHMDRCISEWCRLRC